MLGDSYEASETKGRSRGLGVDGRGAVNKSADLQGVALSLSAFRWERTDCLAMKVAVCQRTPQCFNF